MKIHEYNEMMKWLTRPAPDPSIRQLVTRMPLKPGGLVEPGVTHYGKIRGPFKEEVIQIYNDIKKSGKKVFTRDIAERVTKSKMTGDALKSQIAEYLKRENLPYEKSDLGRAEEARTKAAKTLKEQRIEKVLSSADKKKFFADIRKYRSGPITGPRQIIKITDFAKYFPEGTSPVQISRNVNRIANEILKLPDHPILSKAEELAARRERYKILKKGDPENIFKKIPKEPGKVKHHMRAKGIILGNKIIAISPSLGDISRLDAVTNSVKLQESGYEQTRNKLARELLELRENKPKGWERRVKEINALARHESKKIPKHLRPYLFFETMDEAGNLKPIGGDPMKSIAKLEPEGKIKFDTKNAKLLLDNFWCGRKVAAEGGRIGFKAGSGCSVEVRRRNFLALTNDVAKGRVTGETAEQIAKNAAKVVGKAGSKSALAAIFGIGGIGLDLAYEIGSIGTDMAMDSNVTLKGALQNNWITGAFIEGTGQQEYHKGLTKFDSGASPKAIALDLIDQIESAEKNLETIKESNLGRTDYTGKTKQENIAKQEDVIKNLYTKFNKVARKKTTSPGHPEGEQTRYLALEPGSPEDRAYQSAKQEYDSMGEATALLKKTSKAGFEQMIKEGAQKRSYSKYGYVAPEKYGEFTQNELDQMLKWAGVYGPYVNPKTFGLSGYEQLSDFASNQRKMFDIAQAGGVANMNAGGRVPFGKGKLVDEGRRAFMKWLAGITGTTIAAGTGLLKWGKVAGKGKTVVKAADHVVQGTSGMPDWFIPLVNRIVKEGDDVTAKLATKEREIVHSKKIEGHDVDVYQDLTTGDIRVVVEGDTGKNLTAYDGGLELEYTAPIADVTSKGKPFKTKSDFNVAETEAGYSRTGPDDTDLDISFNTQGRPLKYDRKNMTSVVDETKATTDGIVSDTNFLKNYAKKKKSNMGEIVETTKKKNEIKYLNDNPHMDPRIPEGPEPNYDDYLPGIDDLD